MIEYLETLDNQRRFESECARVGTCYYFQTPNRWFPVEPRFITAFIYWLLKQLQKHHMGNFTLWWWIARPAQSAADSFMREVRLLDKKNYKSDFQMLICGKSGSLVGKKPLFLSNCK